MSIEVEGLEELTKMLEDATLSKADERNAMKKAIEPAREALEKDSPRGKTGKLAKVKATVKQEDFNTTGIVKSDAFYDKFQDWGTSKQKAHVGYFDRSIESTKDKVIEILGEELLKKIK